ncbi:MAG TPA: tetratricopeptide repeat protein [Candidatus Binatia bacterium]|jgi:tetratricopeptide (TPR) repeat protein
MNFCSQCGARVESNARFCSSCGHALAPASAAAAAAPAPAPRPSAPPAPPPAPRGWREQLPGLVVLAVFLAAGLGVWVTILRPGTSAPAAPTRPAAQEASGGMPAGHPPTTLPDEAKKFIATVEEKAKAAPDDVSAWKTLAQVQARAGEIDPAFGTAAIDSYQHVLKLAPDDEDAIRGLGNVYYDQQKYAEAAAQYERYLAKHPDDPSTRTDLATTYLYQRQFDRAVGAYQEVIKAHPDFLQAHFNLGLAYEAMGKREEAMASLAKARGLATDEQTRGQIDRVTAQLKGEAGGARMAEGAPLAPASGGTAPQGGPGGGRPAAGPAAPASGGAAATQGTDFKSAVEAGLRAHPILGPKITAIEWPKPTTAVVRVANFPMQSMPEFARNLFHSRLETILDDAKTRFPTDGETAIDMVDASSGQTMEHVTH